MRFAFVLFLTVAALVRPSAQAPAPATAPSPPSSGTVPVVLSGCLEPAADGHGFVLRARPATGHATSATGTSATGTAPSGSVTGKTPTGATATEVASPTPAVGVPPATANPASPTYNQPASGAQIASVSSGDTAAQTGVVLYRLTALAGVNLREHAGHTVEVTGTVTPAARGTESCCSGLQGPSARSHEPEAKQPRAGATGTSGRAADATSADLADAPSASMAVASITHVAPTCRP